MLLFVLTGMLAWASLLLDLKCLTDGLILSLCNLFRASSALGRFRLRSLRSPLHPRSLLSLSAQSSVAPGLCYFDARPFLHSAARLRCSVLYEPAGHTAHGAYALIPAISSCCCFGFPPAPGVKSSALTLGPQSPSVPGIVRAELPPALDALWHIFLHVMPVLLARVFH